MDKQYTINEVARLLDISTDAIRLYEKEGLVTPLRNPINGYRYYNNSHMQKIMGIHLYRELDMSIADIRKVMTASSFSEVSDSFLEQIQKNEQKLLHLQRQTEKLRFMKQHIDTLNQSIGTYRITDLPACYILYQQDSGPLQYQNTIEVLTSTVFSFGNFRHCLETTDSVHYQASCVQFVIREPMMDLCPWKGDRNNLPREEGKRCLYTVMHFPIKTELCWNFDGLLSYAKEYGYSVSSHAYAFYVYSLDSDDTIVDYYEIYLPIEEN